MAKYLHLMTATSDTLGLTVQMMQVEYTATWDDPGEVSWAGGYEIKRNEGLTFSDAAALADELIDALDNGEEEYIEQFWDISWERCVQKEDPRD